MTEHTLQQFGDELKSFFVLVLLNMAFGALALAFGMQIILATFLPSAAGEPLSPVLSTARIIIGITGICIGFFWILASMKILRGIKGIHKEYRNSIKTGPVPAETLTSWIVAMLAHYRENKSVIWRMTLISIAGGIFFLALGIANVIQGVLALPALEPAILAFFGAAPINSGIGIVTLYAALKFRRYAARWDNRQKLADEGENSLKNALESR
ncbi:hypothetical protein [Methanoregula sp.]|uniref:hypothetical protein n=1 Tax=Methanoregula sp. TaxID=2052170 RepID=UPI002C544379|nr:hypothetical protein [Methanoregula sp.]HVP96768.1 hypothetical protein [Methanoregula sp.]